MLKDTWYLTKEFLSACISNTILRLRKILREVLVENVGVQPFNEWTYNHLIISYDNR